MYIEGAISTEQKKEGITPHQQQYGGKESLQDASEIEIKAWGELTYIYVKKKDRDGKLAPKAVRCIWNGTNPDNIRSVSGIPIVAKNGQWQLMKPIHSAQAITIRGCFPLKDAVDADLPEPPETETITAAEAEEESDTEQEGQTWSKRGSNVVQTWSKRGPNVVQTWSKRGHEHTARNLKPHIGYLCSC